jgi:hypothetical protein
MVELFRGETVVVILLLLEGSDAELLAGNVYAMGSGVNDCRAEG